MNVSQGGAADALTTGAAGICLFRGLAIATKLLNSFADRIQEYTKKGKSISFEAAV